MRPTFSIITTAYNRGYVVWKAIQSAQKQVYPYFELLVIDDGSTDNTKQIVAEFQKDPRIKYFKIKHAGGSIARNYGLLHAKGNIITYIDSDDYVYENFLTVPLEFFKKFPKKVFAIPNYNRRLELYDKDFHLVDFVKSSSEQKANITLQDFFHWNIKTCGTGIFHKKETLKKVKWDPKIPRAQDWDFIMSLGNAYPNGFMHIPYVLFEYQQTYGTNSMCSSAKSYNEWADCFEKMYRKHKDDPLMKGQKWYPAKITKYKNLQKLFEEGKVPPPQYKDFPKFFK